MGKVLQQKQDTVKCLRAKTGSKKEVVDDKNMQKCIEG